MSYYQESLDLRRILGGDKPLLNLLGGAPQVHIQDVRIPQDPAGKRIICYYPAPGVRQRNYLTYRKIYQFDIHTPYKDRYAARQILDRIDALFQEPQLNKYMIELEGDLGELATVAGYYCIGVRYSFLTLRGG